MSKLFLSSVHSKPNKHSLNDLFPNKSTFEKILSFLSPKEKFRLLSNSKELAKEFDSKIDDCFMTRKYQEKIKNYNGNYEDLFYLILQEMKKEKEKKNEKICLYEIENDMIKYLKYLTSKQNKIIQLSLININSIDIWKFEFISKLLEVLDKNIHLKIKMCYSELRGNDIFEFVCKCSNAINILEIYDIRTANKEKLSNLFLKTIFNWNSIHKLIINMSDHVLKENKPKTKDELFLIRLLNQIECKNLTVFDMRCNFINFNDIGNFVDINGKKIKKLSIENYFLNKHFIEKNDILKKFENVEELSLTVKEDKFDKQLYYFYPIFPKIKKFHLIIIESENKEKNDDIIDEDEEEEKENEDIQKKGKGKEKEKKLPKKNKSNNKYKKIEITSSISFFESELNEVGSEEPELEENDDDFISSKNINYNRISITTSKTETPQKKKKKHKGLKKEKNDNYNLNYFPSSLSNLNNCESLIYEIKSNYIYSKDKKTLNFLSYLINFLQENKNHLKYLEININTNETIPIDIKDFVLLIQKISDCKNLEQFAFEFELQSEYANLFNENFIVGPSLTHLSLIHNSELDIMKIINDHINLKYIKFELISSKKECQNYRFNLSSKRDWKNIDLTNYPINNELLSIIKNKKNMSSNFYLCTNVSDLDDKSFNERILSTTKSKSIVN